MEIIRERKKILIEEETSGTKGAAGKDLLTLLIRANIRDKDGMSDEAVLARTRRSFGCCARGLIGLPTLQKYRLSLSRGTRRRVPLLVGPCLG